VWFNEISGADVAAAVQEGKVKQPRNGSLFALAWYRERVAEMSAEQMKRETIARVTKDDDAILGQLFHAYYVGAIGEATYSELYRMTNAYGKFTKAADRLVAVMMLEAYRTPRGRR
jgi:hypothetical protein